MYTQAAARTLRTERQLTTAVHSLSELAASGVTDSQMRAHVAALRWRRIGRAMVLHRGDLTKAEQWAVALANCEPSSCLASFTALEAFGLDGWERDEVHLLASAGARRPGPLGFPVRLHRTTRLDQTVAHLGRRVQRPAPALILAASGFRTLRPALGLLAAGVQQRLVTAQALAQHLAVSTRVRHRQAMAAAVDEVAMGAQALSEIDFVRLCRRYGLPAPTLQSVRREPDGRRRYLDAEWRRRDGRRLVVEVDGAIHLAPSRWFDDQLRQNEVVLANSLVLRYPTFIVRNEPSLVANQLFRALS